MKLSIATLSALSFFLLGSTTANFDVYQDDEYNGLGKSGFLVFNNDPSCENVLKAPFFDNRPDVSGNKKGVRQYIKDGAVQELEMHFSNNPLYHWTIYKSRGYRMEGLDHGDYGNCVPFPDHSMTCGDRHLTRKFRCLTKFTASDIGYHAND